MQAAAEGETVAPPLERGDSDGDIVPIRTTFFSRAVSGCLVEVGSATRAGQQSRREETYIKGRWEEGRGFPWVLKYSISNHRL